MCYVVVDSLTFSCWLTFQFVLELIVLSQRPDEILALQRGAREITKLEKYRVVECGSCELCSVAEDLEQLGRRAHLLLRRNTIDPDNRQR